MPLFLAKIKVLCCWEHQTPSCLGEALASRICNGMSHWDGWVTSHPWVRGNYSVSTGISLSCCKLDLLKCNMPEMEHASLKEGRRWGSWSGISHPQAISSCLTVMPPQGQNTRYVQPGQVPKAEATLTSRDQNTHIYLTEGKELLIQVPTKYLSSWS